MTGNKVVSADDVEKVAVAGASVIDVEFANGNIHVEGDSDGITVLVEKGTANAIGIEDLDPGATFAVTGSSFAINGESVIVNNDPDGFTVVGAEPGVSAITNVSGGAEVVAAGGASVVKTDSVGKFTFADGEQVFESVDDTELTFGLEEGTNVVASIDGLSGSVKSENFDDLTGINGKEFEIDGDEGDLIVTGDGVGLTQIANVGASAGGTVTITNAGGASTIVTDAAGTFVIGDQEFETDDAELTFTLDDTTVTAIDGLGENYVAGQFDGTVAINGQSVAVTGDGNVKVYGADDGISKIDDVNAGSVVEAWGNAAAIGASGVGEFTIGEQVFTTEGDSAFTFVMGEDEVTGIEDFADGKVTFSGISALKVNDVEMTFASEEEITLTIDEDGKVVVVEGLAGESAAVTGVAGASVIAKAPVSINGAFADVTEADADGFIVDVDDAGAFSTIKDVTGAASINVDNVAIEADASGDFKVFDNEYSIADEDGAFSFDIKDQAIAGISALEGSIVFGSQSAIAVEINGTALTINNGGSGVAVETDGTDLTQIGVVASEAEVAGLSGSTNVVLFTDGTESTLVLGDTTYTVTGDEDNITISADGVIVGLDEDASLQVAGAADVTVNGNDEFVGIDEDDVIIGSEGGENAYLYTSGETVIRPNTPIEEIEEILGLDDTWAEPDGVIPEQPEGGDSSAFFGPSALEAALEEADLTQDLELFATNGESSGVQEIPTSEEDGLRKVHLLEGDQSIDLQNDEGGNEVIVEEEATGTKEIGLGDGGDAVIVKGSDDGASEVDIIGGAGADSVVVQGNVPTTFDMGEDDGEADKFLVAKNAGAQATLDNYNPEEGDQIIAFDSKFDDLLAAIKEGGISFGTDEEGNPVVTIGTGDGASEITINDDDPTDGTIVDIANRKGDSQIVGFTSEEGGTLDTSEDFKDEDVMIFGNVDGEKEGAEITSGDGDDTIYAGAGDKVNAGAGDNLVQLMPEDREDSSTVILGAEGTTTIQGLSSGFDEENDVLDFAPDADGPDETVIDGTSLILRGTNDDGEEYEVVIENALGEDDVAVEQKIIIGGEELQAAVIREDAVYEVPADDEDVPNLFRGNGDGSGVDFSEYEGPVVVDMSNGQEWNGSQIGDKAVRFDSITSFQAGSGSTAIYGSEGDDEISAGSGDNSLYGAGGENILNGYDGDDKEGSTTFFAVGDADGGSATINTFEFADQENFNTTADKLNFFGNKIEVVASEDDPNDVVVQVTNPDTGATETLTISDAISTKDDPKNMAVVMGKDGVVTDYAQIGDDELVFMEDVTYYNAVGEDATVYLDDNTPDEQVAKVWLADIGKSGVEFVGDIKTIDASEFAGDVELAGNDDDNEIIGGTGANSLWGGVGGNDTLFGNPDGDNTFYYDYDDGIGNGNDVIEGAHDGDIIHVIGATLDDITYEFTDTGVVLNFTEDGNSLKVNSQADVTYVADKDGSQWKADHDNRKFNQIDE